MKLEIPGTPKPYVMCHRGSVARCPENTLAAFRQALAEGTDLIETDVHMTADGHLVCIHDDKVDRTTDGTGAIRDMSLHQIRSLSAGCGRAAFEHEMIPTLQEIFELVPGNMFICLELKTDDFLDPAPARQLVTQIQAAGRHERIILLSFSSRRLQSVQQQAATIGLALPTGLISLTRALPTSGINLLGPFWPLLFLNPLYVWWAHRRGQQVCPLDPSPNRRLWYYHWLGCDAVLTDNPAATLHALGRTN